MAASIYQYNSTVEPLYHCANGCCSRTPLVAARIGKQKRQHFCKSCIGGFIHGSKHNIRLSVQKRAAKG